MNNQQLIRVSTVLFIVSVFFVGIILAKDVLIPIAVSVFFTYLLYPVVREIEKRGIHRAIAILLVLLLSLIILGGIALFLSVKISNMDIDLSGLKQQFNEKIDSFLQVIEVRLGVQGDTITRYFSKASGNIFSSWESQFGKFFSATTTTIFQIGLLPVYTFFLLFYRTKTAHFIFRLAGRKNKRKTLYILREISTVTTKYIGGLLVVVLILAILNSTGLYIIGIPHALLFGVVAAVLNLVPYIGTFVGGLLPILFTLFTSPDPFKTILQIFILFSAVQFIENNLLTPNIVGNNIQINPLAIILGLLLANMVWGVAGMLIVVPCLAILKIIMRNVDELKPFAFLISDRGIENHKVKLNFKWLSKKSKKKQDHHETK